MQSSPSAAATAPSNLPAWCAARLWRTALAGIGNRSIADFGGGAEKKIFENLCATEQGVACGRDADFVVAI